MFPLAVVPIQILFYAVYLLRIFCQFSLTYYIISISAGLKKFKHSFELILESETLLDKSKSHLASCEQRENKIRKELKRANMKGNVDEAKQLTERQTENQALVKIAQTEGMPIYQLVKCAYPLKCILAFDFRQN